MKRSRKRGSSRKGKPPRKVSKSPKEAEVPHSTSSTRKSRLTTEHAWLLVKLAATVLGAVAPAVKLIELLMRS